jgi:hypothetical protein
MHILLIIQEEKWNMHRNYETTKGIRRPVRYSLAVTERNQLVNDTRISEGACVPKFIQLPCSNLTQNPSHDLATPSFRESRRPVDPVRSCKCPNLKQKGMIIHVRMKSTDYIFYSNHSKAYERVAQSALQVLHKFQMNKNG